MGIGPFFFGLDGANSQSISAIESIITKECGRSGGTLAIYVAYIS